MATPRIGAVLLMAVLMASTSGCMGLIAARESVESLREPAYDSLNNKKITVSHEFTSLADYAEEYVNRSTFTVTEQTTEIGIYFKVTFELSESPLIGDLLIDNESHYVHATLTDSNGVVQWEQDVSEDASPLEERLQPNPSFPLGEWVLDVRARGGGESTLNAVHDNFLVIVTVTNTCVQYPLVEDCF
ncbi:MAG: hypothetical protein ACPHJD_04525 [Poseidonia sp.]|jgi:hypothetical protein